MAAFAFGCTRDGRQLWVYPPGLDRPETAPFTGAHRRASACRRSLTRGTLSRVQVDAIGAAVRDVMGPAQRRPDTWGRRAWGALSCVSHCPACGLRGWGPVHQEAPDPRLRTSRAMTPGAKPKHNQSALRGGGKEAQGDVPSCCPRLGDSASGRRRSCGGTTTSPQPHLGLDTEVTNLIRGQEPQVTARRPWGSYPKPAAFLRREAPSEQQDASAHHQTASLAECV